MMGFVKSGKYSKDDIIAKISAMYERIGVPSAKELARPLWRDAMHRLAAL